MDPDEFVARMVAAGVPDMQLLPQPGSPKAGHWPFEWQLASQLAAPDCCRPGVLGCRGKLPAANMTLLLASAAVTAC